MIVKDIVQMSAHVSHQNTTTSNLKWSKDIEILALEFTLTPQQNATLIPHYTIGLHAWFLDQVRQTDPDLSAYLHDGQSEKAFTVSSLEGNITTAGKQLHIFTASQYRWRVTALSPVLVQWIAQWVKNLPPIVDLRAVTLEITEVNLALLPTTYAQLFQNPVQKKLSFTFTSPTSFRHKGHHYPLPVPTNIFHSYLRRWNNFSGIPFDQEEFLTWVDENVIITRHSLESVKVAAGKRGLVTGFLGAIEYSLSKSAFSSPEWVQLFSALGELAPYCGTGHKTTFGLGQTRLGWLSQVPTVEALAMENSLAQRIEEVTEVLMGQQKRQGGERGLKVCETRATILARQEFGESLKDIAKDLNMPYETVKTYAKLARKGLREV